MSVIGFNFTSVSGHVDETNLKGDININSVPTIESIEKHDLSSMGIENAVNIKFKFVTSYEPKAGELKFEGNILYQVEDAKKIVKQWKDGNKMDDKMALDVLNTIFRKCLAKAVELSDTLRLPPPIRFPIVTTEKPSVSGN